jgi:hypothetical protein
MFLGHYQTMRLSFEQICQGETPWVALGNFMNDWYAYHFEERERLVVDPLPEEYPQEYHKWASFCAASVLWFCSTYELPCPSWADNPRYVLPEPWYMDYQPGFREHLRKSTAEEFTRYNIYCGDCVYKNKYERDEQGSLLRFHPVDLQERRNLVRSAGERLAREWTERERLVREYMPIAEALREKYRQRAG